MAGVPSISFDSQVASARFQALQSQMTALQATASTATKGTTPATKAAAEAQLKKASQEFESIFINILMERMRAATPKSGFLDSSQEHDIFTSMQDQEISRKLAASGGLGIAKMIFEQLKKTL